MQAFATLSETDKASVLKSMAPGEQYQLKDNRDGKYYYISKLNDDNIWMTQNLDLCIGCEGVELLTSKNTDLTSSQQGIYQQDYTNIDDTITWTPPDTAITSGGTISGTTVSRWSSSSQAYLAYSAEGGDVYVFTSEDANYDETIYNSLVDCISEGHLESECRHYHRGNYYSWTAAIASSGSSNARNKYFKADNSICPAGWRLPVGENNNATREFEQLLLDSNIISTASSANYTSGGFRAIRTAPLYFIRAGLISQDRGFNLEHLANSGTVWSSTLFDGTRAFSLNFNGSYVYSANPTMRYAGTSVRCIVR